MLRDSLKSPEYFERYIQYQDTRIQKFTNILKQLKNNATTQRNQCNTYLSNFYKDKLSAMYSYGNTKSELFPVFNCYMGHTSKTVVSCYSDFADLLALMILFDDASIHHQEFILSVTEFDDPFIIRLKQYLVQEQISTACKEVLLYPKQYSKFLSILEEHDLAKSTLNLLDYMNNHWYNNCSDLAWFESHKNTADTYCGYWCWLSAAIAKIKQMDLSFIRTGKYIPWEII